MTYDVSKTFNIFRSSVASGSGNSSGETRFEKIGEELEMLCRLREFPYMTMYLLTYSLSRQSAICLPEEHSKVSGLAHPNRKASDPKQGSKGCLGSSKS